MAAEPGHRHVCSCWLRRKFVVNKLLTYCASVWRSAEFLSVRMEVQVENISRTSAREAGLVFRVLLSRMSVNVQH